jgi:hypothetical protein
MHDKFTDCWDVHKKAKCIPLAPIEVEILLYRGSVQKIVMESGTHANREKPSVLAPKSKKRK